MPGVDVVAKTDGTIGSVSAQSKFEVLICAPIFDTEAVLRFAIDHVESLNEACGTAWTQFGSEVKRAQCFKNAFLMFHKAERAAEAGIDLPDSMRQALWCLMLAATMRAANWDNPNAPTRPLGTLTVPDIPDDEWAALREDLFMAYRLAGLPAPGRQADPDERHEPRPDREPATPARPRVGSHTSVRCPACGHVKSGLLVACMWTCTGCGRKLRWSPDVDPGSAAVREPQGTPKPNSAGDRTTGVTTGPWSRTPEADSAPPKPVQQVEESRGPGTSARTVRCPACGYEKGRLLIACTWTCTGCGRKLRWAPDDE